MQLIKWIDVNDLLLDQINNARKEINEAGVMLMNEVLDQEQYQMIKTSNLTKIEALTKALVEVDKLPTLKGGE